MSLAKQRAEGYLVNARRRQRRLRRQRRRRQRRTSFACIYFHFRLWPRTWQTTPHTHTDTHTPPFPFPLLVPCTANAYNVLLLKGSGGEGWQGKWARGTQNFYPRELSAFFFFAFASRKFIFDSVLCPAAGQMKWEGCGRGGVTVDRPRRNDKIM